VLPTGDTVALTPAGAQVLPGGPSKAFDTSTGADGDMYLVPAEAVPFAGRQLDMSLFDVTKLAARAAGDSGGRIQVTLGFAAGVTPSAPAGVTVTAVSGQTATGYLTPASGAAFAAALRQQIAADKAAGRAVGSEGLLGLNSMRVAGAGTPVTPNYALRILQINAVGTDGAPLDSYVTLVNTDNSHIMTLSEPIVNGVARVAVPAGNYAAYMSDFTFDALGDPIGDALVSVNDFAVPAAGDVPALTLDARTATAPVSVTTQQPSTPGYLVQRIVRTPTTGPAAVIGAFEIFNGGTPITMTPQPAAKVGAFLLDTFENFVGPGAAGQSQNQNQYQYFLDFTSDHIDADQAHHPADHDLAAETEDIASDPVFAGAARSVDATPVVPGAGAGLSFGTSMPLKSTAYFTPGSWLTSVFGPWGSGPGTPQGPSLWAGARTFHAGQVSERTWEQAPAAPVFGRYPEAAVQQDCQACVGAGNMDLEFYDNGDSNPDTLGSSFDGTDTAAFYWNGQQVPAAVGPNPAAIVPNIGTGPATVRAVLDTKHTAGETQSTSTHTDVTFQYTGKTDPWATLPDGNYCPAALAAGQPSAPCQIMPVLAIGYQYTALSPTNVSQSPVQSLVLDIGHHSFGGHGSLAPVVSAQVSVSFDGGTTWQDVPTLGALGHYAALWRNPAPGTPVTVRVTAADSIGGSITQTVTNPYTVGER
jgi:hypothetical protein